MPVISVPRPLRERLGEEATDSLVELINEATEETKVDVIALVEEKFERRLAEELAKLRTELKDDIFRTRSELLEHTAALHAKLAGDIAALDAKVERRIAFLEVQMATLKADVIRWMFIFWIGQLGAIIGVLFAFFKR